MNTDMNAVLDQLEIELETAKKDNDLEKIFSVNINLGRFRINNQEVDKGMMCLAAAVVAARKIEDKSLLFRGISAQGAAFSQTGDLEKAQAKFEAAAELADELDDNLLRSDAASNLGIGFAQSGNLQKGLEKLDEAIVLAKDSGDKARMMRHLGTMGNIFLTVADVDGAVKVFTEAASVAEEIGDKASMIGMLYNLGVVKLKHKVLDGARKDLESALALIGDDGDLNLKVNILRQLVDLASETKDFQRVVSYTDQLLAIPFSPEDLEAARKQLGKPRLIALMNLEKYSEVIDEGSILLSLTADTNKMEAYELQSLQADAHYNSGHHAEALDLYTKCREILVEIGNVPMRAVLQGRIGSVLADMGRLEESNSELESAVEICTKAGYSSHSGEYQFLLAMNYLESEDYEKAVELAELCLKNFEEQKLSDFADKANILLAQIREAADKK